MESADPDRIAEVADFAVLSLPNGLACRMAPELIARGVRVVDCLRISATARWTSGIRSMRRRQKVQRDDAELCRRAVYGLPEWHGHHRRGLRGRSGCFPTASLLPLLPFLKQGLIETDSIIIDAKTRTSGGGRVPKEAMLLAEASESISPYGVIGHRHTSEIEQMAREVAGQDVRLQFTPHLVPMVRGLLSTVYARLRDPGLTAEDCTTVLDAVYRHHPCVSVLPVGTYPATKWARHTNRALVSVQVDTRTGQMILMSAIDNLIKGQAGQGVQCLNLMDGLPPETGLPLQSYYP